MPTAGDIALLPDGTPEQLGRYRLVRPISTGGMARVFEARRESLAGVAPKVALKVILPEFSADESFQQLFVNEARIGSLLHHQNLVQIQDFDRSGDRFFLVMEYVDGVTLRRVMTQCRRHGLVPPLAVVAEIGRQVCDGLDYAHNARSEDGLPLHLVHRDIKPSNLMVTPQGLVKTLDFGISKALISAERRGAVRGTWGYMSPEQAEGHDVGPAADLFGLAAVLYELVAGEPLFPEKEPGDVRHLLARDEAARRANQLGGPYAPLAGVLVRALQRDPAARFASASAMARALGGLVTDPVSAREQVAQFQASVVTLGQGTPQPPHYPADPRRSASTMGSRPGTLEPVPQPGLPVAVGGPHGPQRVGDIRVDARPHPPSARPPGQAEGGGGQRIATVLFVLVALGIVGFTGWQVFRPGPVAPAPVAAAPAPSPDNPLAGLGEDPKATAGSVAAAPEPAVVEAPKPATKPRPKPAEASSAQVVPAAEPVGGAHVVPSGAGAPEDSEPARRAASGAAQAAPPATDARATEPTPGDAALPEVAPSEPAVAPGPARLAPPGMGLLTVSAIPRAQVIVDGRYVRYSPLFRYEVEAGGRVITLITDDGRRTTFPLDVPDGGEARRVWSFDEGAFVSQ